jgi:hypothetical protein
MCPKGTISASAPITSDIALEPNVGFRGTPDIVRSSAETDQLRMTQTRPGRAISICSHVRYATKSDDRLLNCDPSRRADAVEKGLVIFGEQ